jgi:hypothetical protein
MAMVCQEIQDWVETQVQQPIDTWENQLQQTCQQQDCNWWCLCCNKWLCWMVWVLVKVVTWVVVTVGNWVTRVVCEIVSFVLDVIAFVVNLILSIPILGGIIRTILNWVTEIIWRLVGLLDFVGSLIGIRPEKRIYFGLVILRQNGTPLTTEAAMLPMITKATDLYKNLCNVKLVYSGACTAGIDAPDGALNVNCDGGGFFSDWWVGGSHIEFVTSTCKFSDGWRRVVGYGAEIVVVVIANVGPDSTSSDTVGCSFASTHNYVVVEPGAGPAVAAHEMGHACWLSHVTDDANNLMWPSNIAANPTLTNLQVSLIRWSKHCVYF